MQTRLLFSLGLALAISTQLAAAKLSHSHFEGRIEAHAQFQVEHYDPKSSSYHILRAELPLSSKGWLYVTPESIADSVDSITYKTIKDKPESIVGNVYSTDTDMVLVSPKEIMTDPKFTDAYKRVR